ncbi:uncharacterized protein LOC124637154 [Helicoverpa zea]|uniref:uncharacterized protein LOC124637154 n=1 Tax=Helicoverpa zea TaxID=7113 RepID=UPI001F56BB24|nr:uncharacterized protein LOC124637154 [Helicoverpa zea]
MIRCINCGLNIFRMRRYSLETETEDIRRLIQQQNAITDIPRDSVVCHACWLLLHQSIEAPGPLTHTVGHRNVCVHCGRSLYRSRAHTLSSNTEREVRIRAVVAERILPRSLRTSDRICHPCWQRCDSLAEHYTEPSTSSAVPPLPSTSSAVPPLPSTSEESSADIPGTSSEQVTQHVQIESSPSLPQEVSTIVLSQYGRASDSQARCFFPGCHHAERLVVPLSIRIRLFVDFKFYVPADCRICNYHLRGNLWHQLNEIEVNHTFTEAYIYDFVSLLSKETSIDFENIDMMDNHLVHYWFGISKEQFRTLLAEVTRLSQMHRGSTALAALLLKLRNGDSNERIASLFQMPRSTLENLMSKARELLQQDFVPMHLGLSHMTRAEIANRNLLIPNGLFGGINENGERLPIVIVDGTYIYCQKSSNYKYQKDTYSLHKYRNLVKPFMFVCCDGYILEVLGPYPATTSDGDIMQNEFINESQPLRQYFRHGDVFILDRGFRDAVSVLENSNYSVHMPLSLEENETQLSTLAANRSRTVTMCRWVVETVNGIFKEQFKIFRHEFFNRASSHLMVDFSIAAALINRFHCRYTDRTDAAQILEIINQKMYQNNVLADFINNNNYNRRRAHFTNINVDSQNISNFPQLTQEDLILIACGTYQIKQARSYYGEHIRYNGSYTIEVCREAHLSNLRDELSLSQNHWLLRGKIQSRHISRKIYYVYIIINNNVSGREAVEHYCCNCIVGRRTVGCCAHTMTILWYLGWARHETNITPPAQFLDDLLIKYDDILFDE